MIAVQSPVLGSATNRIADEGISAGSFAGISARTGDHLTGRENRFLAVSGDFL